MNAEIPPRTDHPRHERTPKPEPSWILAGEIARQERAWHRTRTERLRIYAILLQATLPRIGVSAPLDSLPLEIDPDVDTARHLALEAVFADIRRIATASAH